MLRGEESVPVDRCGQHAKHCQTTPRGVAPPPLYTLRDIIPCGKDCGRRVVFLDTAAQHSPQRPSTPFHARHARTSRPSRSSRQAPPVTAVTRASVLLVNVSLNSSTICFIDTPIPCIIVPHNSSINTSFLRVIFFGFEHEWNSKLPMTVNLTLHQ